MAWNIRGRQTEHAGAKHGNGAYWGPKAIAKHASSKERRVKARRVVTSVLGEVELTDTAPGGVGRDVRCATGLAAESGMRMVSDHVPGRASRRVRRNTRRWCRGKVGHPHAFVLREKLGELFGLPALHVWACTRCGRKAYNLKASRGREES